MNIYNSYPQNIILSQRIHRQHTKQIWQSLTPAKFVRSTAKSHYLNSSQLLTGIVLTSILQNARMKALASRALVMSGILWSIAARRIL